MDKCAQTERPGILGQLLEHSFVLTPHFCLRDHKLTGISTIIPTLLAFTQLAPYKHAYFLSMTFELISYPLAKTWCIKKNPWHLKAVKVQQSTLNPDCHHSEPTVKRSICIGKRHYHHQSTSRLHFNTTETRPGKIKNKSYLFHLIHPNLLFSVDSIRILFPAEHILFKFGSYRKTFYLFTSSFFYLQKHSLKTY